MTDLDKKENKKKRLRLPKRMFENVPAFFKDMEFRPVRSADELMKAGKLIYLEYLKCGYIKPNPAKVHLTLFHAVPSTTTFVAIYKGKHVLGTVSLVEDTRLGLPMEKIYSNELAKLRSHGRRLAEVSALALDEETLGKPHFAMSRWQRLLFLFHLYRAMFQSFRASDTVDELVACFLPTHDFMYAFLGFEPMGTQKFYSTVGVEAVGRHLNKKEAEIKALVDPDYQDLMFYCEAPTEPPVRMAEKELRRVFFEKLPALFKSATAAERFYSSYPPEFGAPLLDVLRRHVQKKSN